jgi:hypothetical protein
VTCATTSNGGPDCSGNVLHAKQGFPEDNFLDTKGQSQNETVEMNIQLNSSAGDNEHFPQGTHVGAEAPTP